MPNQHLTVILFDASGNIRYLCAVFVAGRKVFRAREVLTEVGADFGLWKVWIEDWCCCRINIEEWASG